ncbi:MAG TPA: DUF1592 domain-containing protein [Polyangiaceae bacterium]|jgi:hypothetical protein
MTQRALFAVATTLLIGSAAGCTAYIGGGSTGSSAQPGSGGATGTGTPGTPGNPSTPGGGASSSVPTKPGTVDPANPPDPNAAGPMPLRRLTQGEYNNTVRDLLGVTTNPANNFPSDVDLNFIFRRFGDVSTLDASRMQEAAEAIAPTVDVTKLAPCAATDATGQTACAQTFVTSFGLHAYRRPLVADETTRLMALYQVGRTTLTLDYPGGIKLLIETMLQAPGFVYRWELGPVTPTLEGTVVHLAPYEVASRLSYFLWQTMPDQALFDAAAAGKLATPQDVEAQARRMMDDPKAHNMMASFFQQWLSLDQVAARPKDATVYPQFNDALKASMNAESLAFIDNVAFQGDGALSTFLTANFSFVDQTLAPVYGVTGATATAAKLSLNPAQRAGLLTQSAFLTVTGATDGSNPVKRGRKVYERLLCGVLPPPPPNVPPAAPASAGGTTRQRFAVHDTQLCAKACHTIMDPIGFAFENYDGIGQYRTTDNGLPVDATGAITLDGVSHNFKDAVELTNLLATSGDVRSCFVTQWARFAFNRLDTDADRASLNDAFTAFSKANFTVHELLVGVATSRSFNYRSPSAGEIQ